MADDLSAPLGRKRAAKPKRTRSLPRFSLATGTSLPLARIAAGLLVLIGAAVVGRILFVNDPMGGRPVAVVSVNSPHDANSLAGAMAGASLPPASATITAGPQMPASGGPSITIVGANVPDGNPTATNPSANAQGLFPDLLEQSAHGPIPRISAAGQTPFDAYARPSLTPATAGGKPLIALIVTGLGLNATSTSAAIDLPDAVTLAFAPYGKGLSAEVSSARASGHEILLEVPLEPFDYPDSDPGPDTLLTGQAPRDNLDKLFNVMAKFGGYVGVINHMGARFTASTSDFNPIMEELGSRGLGYLDDGSSNRSVAAELATANNVEFGRADMGLDADPSRAPILDQLKALEQKALGSGQAIGLISALPISVQTLAEWCKTAADRGFTIVPVSALMKKGS